MSETAQLRVGFDVGGTFTDGVLMKGREVLAKAKSLTTQDVTGGIVEALDRVCLLYTSPSPRDRS